MSATIKNRFTLADQLAFAELSGDYNPLHVDPLIARRNLFGRPVVHGIHSVLWALEQWLEKHPAQILLTGLNARFIKPIYLETEVTFHQKPINDFKTSIQVNSLGRVSTHIDITWQTAATEACPPISDTSWPRQAPQALSKSAISEASGRLDLRLNTSAVTERFPCLLKYLPAAQISTLLGSTYLVGMVCPGLHSLFSELSLVSAHQDMGSQMAYQVSRYNEQRFDPAELSIATSSMTGKLKAFVRPQPQAQPDYQQIQTHVAEHEFSKQHALVIGGSRGLGEVVAKMLAAGGARVSITYFQGKQEAQKVVNELTKAGQQASAFPLNVLSPHHNFDDCVHHDQPFTHLYYFATPFISTAIKGNFSATLFQQFCDYYTTGFSTLVNQLKPLGLKKVFYPSTVYIDEVPSNMGEYITAKAAGEALCQFLNKTQYGVTVWAPRLPRMSTDQTLGLIPLKCQSPLEVMLPSLRTFRDLSTSEITVR
ncbi:MAG: SDR family NAD(P)-dependent oxidoreductase [Cyanobacteria bacterium P01_F01_bin.3]